MERISLKEFNEKVIKKYHATIVEKCENYIIYEIVDNLILNDLFGNEEKQKFKKRKIQIEDVYGEIPYDENINIGNVLNIKVNIVNDEDIKNFEISPICNRLFDELIVLIGVNLEDCVNMTRRYKRFLVAKKYIEKINKL